MNFFIFLLEHYAEYKGITAENALAQWDNAGKTKLIYDMYERYHAEAIENAYQDIDDMLAESLSIKLDENSPM